MTQISCMSASTGSNPAVETHGLSRSFGALRAVDNLDLSIPAGSIFGLLGPNGAGKTTTIRILTTMLPPSTGTAHVAGLDVLQEPKKVRKVIGYVSQMLSADGGLTGRENLLLFARIYGIPQRDRKARITESLEFMGLASAGDTLVRHYSGGMIRRLEIAQSMLHRPPVVFLDEPTIGLDPVARHAVWQHLRELQARFGTTIFMTTHDMEEADTLCQYIVIMHRGQAVASGSPESLKAQVGAEADLDDVFLHFVGSSIDDVGGYKESSQVRRTVRRLG